MKTLKKIFTTSDSVQIYYEVTQQADAPWIVLLHGIGGDVRAWDPIRNILLSHGNSVVAIDIRGNGLSDRPTDDSSYTLERFAEDVLEILQKEAIDTSFLVAHCFGGFVASLFAATYPELLRGLVLIDTGYERPAFSETFAENPLFKKLVDLLKDHVPQAHIHKHRDFSHYKGTSDWSIRRLSSDVIHTSVKTYLQVLPKLSAFEGEVTLRKIKVPTHIIVGENDSIYPPDAALRIHSLIKNSTYETIPEANHILILNNPAKVAHAIQRFLKLV